VAFGYDINIIVNQVLPPAVRQPIETVQKQWSAAHLEVRRALEQAGHAVWQDLTAIKGGDEWIKSMLNR
jgi:hypothetical protein